MQGLNAPQKTVGFIFRVRACRRHERCHWL